MKSEKKIFLDQHDDLDVVVDRLIKTRAHIVILNLPKDSVLGASIDNFHVLKRESVTAGKELFIESVDDRILELASLARLRAVNPVFKRKERVVSDILPKFRGTQSSSSILTDVVVTHEDKRDEEPQPYKEKSKPLQPTWFRRKRVVIFIVLVVVAGGLFVVMNTFLPRATIVITLKKTQTTFDEVVEVSSEFTKVDFGGSNILLPGELLAANRNLTMEFPANGKEKIEKKAKGTLTVYNAYSSEPQVLVATTRFLSPDGKLFRLDKRVVIPGAKVTGGKIVPSSIEVLVTADKPGEEYNLESQKSWRIPGFKGSPRYEGFYADALSSLTGGFIGERAVPTEEDIGNAKSAIETALRDALKSQMLILLADRFTLLDGAQEFKISTLEIETGAQKGTFSIFAEAEMRYLIFEEGMLKEALRDIARVSLPPDIRVRDFVLNYNKATVDLTERAMSFSVDGSIVFESDIDIPSLKRQLFGQNEEELKRIIFLLAGLEKANISIWPFWVKRVPTSQKRVEIIVK